MLPLNVFWGQLILASDILRTMNMTVDPCGDFHEYACGNYRRGVPLPEEEASWDGFAEVGKRINVQLRKLLEEPITPDDPKSTRLVKTHYQACMNITQLELLGLDPWKTLIKEAGDWPTQIGPDWKGEADYDWMKAYARNVLRYGTESIVSISIATDSRNATRKILDIDQGGLGLGKREYYLEANHSHVLEAYRKYLTDYAVQLGADLKVAEKDVQDFIEFETKMANISVRDEDRTNFTELYHLVTIGELKEMYPKIPLHIFFDEMTKNGWNLNDSVEINISGDPYLRALPDVLANTSKRVLANYQLWDVISGYSHYIAPSLRNTSRAFREAVYGVKKDHERWEQCVDGTSGDLPLAVSSMYVKQYFQADDKAEVDKMVANIRKAMIDTLMEISWMDDSTRKAALNKMSMMVDKIGYPDYIFNETRLLREKQYIEFHDDQYMGNAIELVKTSFNATKRLYATKVNRTDWDLTAADVNAQYALDYNSITFPAGILQYPFFALYAPHYVTYAHIGAVIGHEITHGFDDEGHQFAGDGNLESWWSEKTLENFSNGSKCFVEQYSSIRDETTGLKLNGELSLGENIADNGGIKLAYKAYRLHSTDGIHNRTLRGLSNFTDDQLFFISYGQLYCDVIRKESLREDIISDVHSPAKYRIIVPLKNFEAFSKAFNCPLNSNMNPEKKCTIW